MRGTKKGKNIKQIFVLLALIGILITLTPTVGATVLWVVPDNPAWYYTGPNNNFLLDETVIVDTNMGSTFSGEVLVLNQASPQDADAESVFLKFFVLDASNIENITIEAVTDKQGNPKVDSISTPATSEFSHVLEGDPPVPEGDYAAFLIGDIPFSGGPSQTGNIDDCNFNPDNADYYVRVPFTINFKNTPEWGFTLYVYAENDLTGKEHAKTAYSHDAGYTHVPEFTTIAIPVAAILGLLFFFNHRKRRKD
jgi:hypothetical protein